MRANLNGLAFFPLCLAALLAPATGADAQKAWFADGFHGGIYGHYPSTFTQFMVDEIQKHPEWKLNLEIEPETWDSARTNAPEAYQAFKALVARAGPDRRLEFVNPAYGQSYLWNISGESIIQQFQRGLRKIHEHFPEAEVTTYCSEEPCFTTCLPGVLKSLGFKQAVLKNPNTCWGGYTRAYGGELVNWVGPDGTTIPTVPRYAIEALKPGSVWETIAAANSRDYVQAALAAGVEHPVGMCLQDAGWRNGPWLQRQTAAYSPFEYVTWSQYFDTLATKTPPPVWRVSQEDIQVSLVWGAQVLQRVAQQVRRAENRVVMAEKLATLASVYARKPWPAAALDEAWRTLLLSQHHDCWIVPYNGKPGDTWADKVRRWTDATCQACDQIIADSTGALVTARGAGGELSMGVFNTMANPRTNLVALPLPPDWSAGAASVWAGDGRQLPSQLVTNDARRELLLIAAAPSLGWETYSLKPVPGLARGGATATLLADGAVRLETDLYRAELDPKRGGAFRSLTAKRLGDRELVDPANARGFNEIRGYFYKEQRSHSTADTPARLEIVEAGPVRVRVKVHGQVGAQEVTQTVTLAQGEPRIDLGITIDWRENPGIGGALHQDGGFRLEQDRKAFYDDRLKLQALFPVAWTNRTIFKDAPFDVTESRLTNTYFEAWSDIKNNVILHWVDLCDAAQGVGLALLTDHTTSYVHGPGDPLGLTLQYSGVGLWGRNYTAQGLTEVNYALLPHTLSDQPSAVWTASAAWNEPLLACVGRPGAAVGTEQKALLTVQAPDWEVTTMRADDQGILVRLFNPSADSGTRTIRYGARASKAELIQLDGRRVRELPLRKNAADESFEMTLPPMGIGTVLITF